jgi:hypothetical protein
MGAVAEGQMRGLIRDADQVAAFQGTADDLLSGLPTAAIVVPRGSLLQAAQPGVIQRETRPGR